MGSKKNQQLVEKLYTQYAFMWLERIIRLSSSAIVWEGLPEEIDTVYLENCLTKNGSAIIIKDSLLEQSFAGMNASDGVMDYDGIPINRHAIMMNGVDLYSNPQESVVIFNNSMRTPDMWLFQMFANEMADIDMAIKVNLNSQKTMPIIPSSQAGALSVENVMSAIHNNMPYLVVDDKMGEMYDKLKSALVFDNRKSFTSDLMIQVQKEKWNRILTFIGINSLTTEKRERVNVPEVNANLDELVVMRNDRLNIRRKACRTMKAIFGWDVHVKYVGDREGGRIYGDLYDPSPDVGISGMDEAEPRAEASSQE